MVDDDATLVGGDELLVGAGHPALERLVTPRLERRQTEPDVRGRLLHVVRRFDEMQRIGGEQFLDGSGPLAGVRLRTDHGELRLITTLTSFATAVDVTLAELHLETFLPADDHTARLLQEFSQREP
jgi:hypothetical protein